MGAMGGPCSGHLLVSQVPLMVESPVGQLNSLPWLSQTGAKSPEQDAIIHGLRKREEILLPHFWTFIKKIPHPTHPRFGILHRPLQYNYDSCVT